MVSARLDGAGAGLPITTAAVSRISPLATCARKDIALVRDGTGGYFAAKVLWRVDIGGIPASVTQRFALKRMERGQGYSEWLPQDQFEMLETALSLDAVPNPTQDDGSVCVLMPCEYR